MTDEQPIIRCSECKRKLTDQVSRDLGVGPVCGGGNRPGAPSGGRVRRGRIETQPMFELLEIPADAAPATVLVPVAVPGCPRCLHAVHGHWPDDERSKPGCHHQDCLCSWTPDEIAQAMRTSAASA